MDKDFQKRFIKGLSFTSTGTFLQIAFGFIGFMVVVRTLTKEQLGVFVIIQLVSSLFSLISSLALVNISVTRIIAAVKGDLKIEAVNTAISYKLLICILVSLVILVCKPIIYHIFKFEQISEFIFYILLFFILSSFDLFFLNILQGFYLYKEMAISQVINSVVRFLLIIIFLVMMKMNVVGAIHAFLLSYTASIVYMFLVIPKKKWLVFNPKLFKEMFSFGLPLGLNNILTFMFTKVDRFMIAAMINPIGVAYYETAAKIPENIFRMYESFQSVFFPNMSELSALKRHVEAEKVLNNSLRLISFITIFATLVVVLFQKEIVILLFSEQYLKSAPALSLLMVSLNMALIGNIMGTTLVAYGYSDKPVKINVFMTIANVLGNWIMIPILGFMGAVYATVFANYLTNSTLSIWFLKKYHIDIRPLEFFKPILVFIFCWIIFSLFNSDNLFIKILIICLFLIICIIFSVISKRDFLILIKGIKE